MPSALLILLVGLLYIFGFGALSYMSREGLSLRFAFEGLILTAAAIALSVVLSVNALIFLLVLYLVTMRVRLLVDLANWFSSRGQHRRALELYQLALRLGPDMAGRQIVLINCGVAQLRMQESEAARLTLEQALAVEAARPGAKYLAAGYYNLGLACRRTGYEAEAIGYYNKAIETLPSSLYARAAELELEKRQPGRPEEEEAME